MYKIIFLFVYTLLVLSACRVPVEPPDDWIRPSSSSIQHARELRLLVTEYTVPINAILDKYKVLEVWVEKIPQSSETQLVVRLKGPHVDLEPRVKIIGIPIQSPAIWSERGGPPYEVWKLSKPFPDTLTLQRGKKTIMLERIKKEVSF